MTLGRDTLAWGLLRDSAFHCAQGARKPADIYGAVDWGPRRPTGTAFSRWRLDRSRARAVLAALSLLVLGPVIGIASDRHLNPAGPSNPAAAVHEMTMSSLDEHVDLTTEQRRQIDDIVAARRHSLSNAWQIVHSQLGAAADSLHQDIEAILTPEQRAAFREWLRGMDAGH